MPVRSTCAGSYSCGTVVLEGDRFQRLAASQDPLTRAALANHFGWFEAVQDWKVVGDMDQTRQTSVLYDAVAIYLAFAEAYVEMETLDVAVTEDGKTLIHASDFTADSIVGRDVRCATAWRDKDAFLDLIVERLA